MTSSRMPSMATLWTDLGVEFSHIDAQSSEFPPHTHDEYVISANLSGCEQVQLHGQDHDVYPGMVTVYNPLTVQASRFGAQGVAFLSLHIPQSVVQQRLVSLGLKARPFVLQEGVISDPEVFQQIRQCFILGAGHQALGEALDGLLMGLCHADAEDEMATQVMASAPEMITYMYDHLDGRLCIDQLASIAGVSRFHFNRLFKLHFGLSPARYHTQLRLIEARRRLREGTAVLDVAYDLGFYDQSHLINCFRRVMGITPHRYAAQIVA